MASPAMPVAAATGVLPSRIVILTAAAGRLLGEALQVTLSVEVSTSGMRCSDSMWLSATGSSQTVCQIPEHGV